jgi:hypothetical protein
MRHFQHRHPLDPARLFAAGLVALVVAVSASSASAGGWAVASLDALPNAAAGQSVDVGFTVLQHGQTPAVLDSDVGIELVLAEGTMQFFPAVADGVPGHYVATVTFPGTAGNYEWHARMGWFGSYELGTIDVAASTTSSAGSGSGSGGGSAWRDLRWITLAGSILLGGVAIVDLVVTRQRRRTAPA